MKDIDHALRELRTARDEMAAVGDDLYKYQRTTALAEPVARLRLVVRFLDDVIEANE